MPDYSGGLTGISWSSAHGKILFDTGGGPGSTATGVLELTLVLDAFTQVEQDEVVTITATNSLGQTITGTLTVRILGLPTVTLTFTPA
jgi:hypothetical protein